MPTADAAVQELRRAPTLPLHLRQLQQEWDEEQERRERFRDEILPHQKGEFINGEIVMHSSVRVRHLEAQSRLMQLLGAYVNQHDLGTAVGEKAMVTLSRNDYEPDVAFFGNEKAARFEPDQVLLPPPDFVAEILSPSTEKTDRTIKFEDYAAHGVREYWLVDPAEETVEQYVLEEGAYALRTKARDGMLESVAVEGFAVPIRALFDKDENLAALRALLQ